MSASHSLCLSFTWVAVLGMAIGGEPSAREQKGTARKTPRDSLLAAATDLIPLNTLATGSYRSFQGGLYAEGKNEPNGAHAEALRRMSALIRPLNKEGRPDPAGKIVVVGIGASVCRQIFDALEELGPTVEGKRPEVVFVNCAKGAHDVHKISDPQRRYWESAQAAVLKAGLSPAQVQVAWYQSDDLLDTRDDFPGRPQRLKEAVAGNMREAKEHFPNLRICYHSARHTTAFMPDTAARKKHGEPRPYHVGWAVKWLIEEQTAGREGLQYKGEKAVAPLLAWATYFWTDGDKSRPDGYRWTADDVVKDGIHLSATGRIRVARELVHFWRADTFARTWFTGAVQRTDSATTAQHAAPVIEKPNPQVAATRSLKPGEPALLINGKSKSAKLERLLGTRERVKLVVFDLQDKQVLVVEDVLHRRTNLNELLPAGNYRLRFLDKDGQRIQMTMDVPDVVRLK